jgi:hypothetical protein
VKKGTRIFLTAVSALVGWMAAPALGQETGATWNKQPTILIGDWSRIDVHARLQSDYLVRNEADPDAATLGFEDRLSLARKRVGVEGMLFDRVGFQVEGEIGASQPWRDVYADVKVNRALAHPGRPLQGALQPRAAHERNRAGLHRPCRRGLRPCRRRATSA